ncbi:hypothetical protein WJX73_001959 [Symbiochloris irregularis]|uniref:Uncharacterized protein n=1 Tax=Symbiochloris irregularis TaxID=706552 RepID=A0AAW1NJL9_9CHLO
MVKRKASTCTSPEPKVAPENSFIYVYLPEKAAEFDINFNTRSFQAQSGLAVAIWMLKHHFETNLETPWPGHGIEILPESVPGLINNFDADGEVEAQGQKLLSTLQGNPHNENFKFDEVEAITVD